MDNNTPHSLAFVPLRWMINQTIECQAGIKYNTSALKSIGIRASPFNHRGPIPSEDASLNAIVANHKITSTEKKSSEGKKLEDDLESQRSSSHRGEHSLPDEQEADRELHDILSPIHDELKRNPLWWLLEIIPLKDIYQDEKGKWHHHLM